MKHCCPVSFFLQPRREQVMVPAQGRTHDPVNSVTAFFRDLVNCKEGRSDREKSLLNNLGHVSSVSTPNGPWVYTVVPWED